MPTETHPKTKRRRYRTRMFDDRLSFPTTSEQVRQLQAESDAEERSVASLVREAIDESLPRLRRRRKHRQTPGELPARRRRRTSEPLAAAPEADTSHQWIVRRLLGNPQKQEVVPTKTDPPPADREVVLWPQRCAGNRFSEREMARLGKEKRRQHPGIGDAGEAARPDRGIRLDRRTETSPRQMTSDRRP